MSISKETIDYVVLTNSTVDSCINIPNLEHVQAQPPWRHSATIYVEINDVILSAEYVFDGHPLCIKSGFEKCVIFKQILPKDVYKADIKIDNNGQKYLRTPEIFFKIWEKDPRIPKVPESLGDPIDAGWTGSCAIS